MKSFVSRTPLKFTTFNVFSHSLNKNFNIFTAYLLKVIKFKKKKIFVAV